MLRDRPHLLNSVSSPISWLAPIRSDAVPTRVVVSVLLVAGVASGWTLVVADAHIRTGWPYFDALQHTLGALGLYGAVGACLGLLAAALVLIEGRWVGRRHRERPRTRLLGGGLFFGIVGGLASVSTAIWTFSGERVQGTPMAILGPAVFATGCGIAAGVGAVLVMLALRAVAQGRTRWWVLIVGLLCCAGTGVAYVDLTQYVALYSRIHTILELVASLTFGAAYAIVLWHCARVVRGALLVTFAAAVAGAWLLASLFFGSVRTWFDESLKHVWLEEVYLGRMLRRVQVAEAFFSDPFNWEGMHKARIERLKKRYGLTDLSLSPAWGAPLAEPPLVWNALRSLRGGQNRYNVIVYYVDTLRADVAADPGTMPALHRFRGTALDFQRAYATGSDTLRSLPALTGGNYDVFQTPPNDILRVAKRADYDTTLVIAKSAFEFLGKLRPEFFFERNLVIEDYPAEQQVWGYGAQRPTAPALVDRGIKYLDERRDRPFFLWLFNFDQHNWRELDADYVQGAVERFGIVDDPNQQPYRYRAVARAIDHEFSRLLQALEERRLLDTTIILFVSDHGEALGRDGFWVHSVFLWESLIRVPLVLRVPKVAPRTVTSKVSLVDVAPTLGRLMDPTLDGRGFHGEDLLTHALGTPPPRRFPLLLLGASKDLLVRVGFVDPVDEFKLVLSFESALPELYDLRASDPDGRNFASEHPARTRRGIRILAHSPIFPRQPDDFEVRDTKEQKGVVPLQPAPSR